MLDQKERGGPETCVKRRERQVVSKRERGGPLQTDRQIEIAISTYRELGCALWRRLEVMYLAGLFLGPDQ
jgi:hypothetical protein